MPTNPDSLTVEQGNAIDLLVLGQSDAEVAGIVGVTRQTVCDWRNHHAGFAAALNRRRKALWTGHGDALRALVNKALAVLAEDLDSPDDRRLRQAAAVHVLRAAGLYGLSEPEGPISANAVELERLVDW